VLRSIGSGITRVHIRLKAGRAMIECCAANIASNNKSTMTAACTLPLDGESIDFGTKNPPTNPAMYANSSKNSTWHTAPYAKNAHRRMAIPHNFRKP
jgi:hypothetical protein